jgi:hypothetical protein
MAQFAFVPRACAAAVLVGALAVSACGESEAPAAAPEVAEAPAPASAPAVDLASLTPQQLILRGQECNNALRPLRQADYIPAEMQERIARSPNISLGDLVFTASDLGVGAEARKQAHDGARPAPSRGDEITAEYTAYVNECADVLDRTTVFIAEHKAAKAAA